MAKKKAVASSVERKATLHDYDVIYCPVLTEKSMKLMQEENKITLKVNKNANKIEIKTAFENLYQAKVESVAIVNVIAKATTRGGRYKGYIQGYKKAIVTLKDGESVKFFNED